MTQPSVRRAPCGSSIAIRGAFCSGGQRVRCPGQCPGATGCAVKYSPFSISDLAESLCERGARTVTPAQRRRVFRLAFAPLRRPDGKSGRMARRRFPALRPSGIARPAPGCVRPGVDLLGPQRGRPSPARHWLARVHLSLCRRESRERRTPPRRTKRSLSANAGKCASSVAAFDRRFAPAVGSSRRAPAVLPVRRTSGQRCHEGNDGVPYPRNPAFRGPCARMRSA